VLLAGQILGNITALLKQSRRGKQLNTNHSNTTNSSVFALLQNRDVRKRNWGIEEQDVPVFLHH